MVSSRIFFSLGVAVFYLLGNLLFLNVAIAEPTPFVMQMTRGESGDQRRAFMQIAKVLQDVGTGNIRIEVVAYEGGIMSLISDNKDTVELVAALARRGVVFKACRISMQAHSLDEEDFPLEVEYVPAGAPEMINLQLKGYKYWRP